MTADALLTRVAVALHGVTPPDPEGALALHRDAAARVVAALGAAHTPGCAVIRWGRREPCTCWVAGLRAALTAEPTP